MEEKIAPCRVCGQPVSEYAQSCPKCGDPTAARYGHARQLGKSGMGLGGKILIGIVGLMVLYACTRRHEQSTDGTTTTASAPANPVPAHQLKVVSFECVSEYGRDHAKMTVVNNGTTTIEYTKAFVNFKDASGKVISAGDSYFRPHTIPIGATASTMIYSSGAGAKNCEPSAVQDRDGHPVTLQR